MQKCRLKIHFQFVSNPSHCFIVCSFTNVHVHTDAIFDDFLRTLDTRAMTTHFNRCLQSGRDICIDDAITSSSSMEQIHNTNSQSISTSYTGNNQRKQKMNQLMNNDRNNIQTCSSSSIEVALTDKDLGFVFLCGKGNFIYGVTLPNHPWYYFDEIDSISSEHESLPPKMLASIKKLQDVRRIAVSLNATQTRKYFENGKFIFNNKPSKTRETSFFTSVL